MWHTSLSKCMSHLRWFPAKGLTRTRSTRKKELHIKPPNSSHRLSAVFHHWLYRFQKESISDARSSIEYIIAHVKGLKTLHSLDIFRTTLSKEEIDVINQLCHLRLQQMPVQYILKEWDFCDLTLKMRPPVLIPRPETEELVEHCEKSLQESLKTSKESPALIEVGCGTGALSLALLHRFQKLRAVAVDISHEACQLTRENAVAVGVDKRLRLVEGNVLDDSVLSELRANGPFCLLVSNPPYIKTEYLPHLQPEILKYEDLVALDGGIDGLDLVFHILKNASSLVLPHCDVWLEVGPEHPKVIQQMTDSQYFPNLRYAKTMKDIFESFKIPVYMKHQAEYKEHLYSDCKRDNLHKTIIYAQEKCGAQP